MANYHITPETAHPKAKALLSEEFFWSGIEETGPFGSDDGSDAFYGFRDWRKSNPQESPVKFLDALLSEWDFPAFNLSELDTGNISKYLSQKTESASNPVSPEVIEHFKKMAEAEGKPFDEEQFKQMMTGVSSSMGSTFLLAQDNAIIAIGFGQFVLEGKIDEDIKSLTKIAINRELLPLLINRWEEPYRLTRIEQLNQMRLAVDGMNN